MSNNKGFTVAVTVCKKNDMLFKLWDNVWLDLEGDKTDLRNLQTQLEVVKFEVNKSLNRNGLALKEVNVNIVFVDRKVDCL